MLLIIGGNLTSESDKEADPDWIPYIIKQNVQRGLPEDAA